MNIVGYLKSRSLFGSKMPIGITHGDLLFLDHILYNIDVNNIIELGTYTGLTSLYFGMSAKLIDSEFSTYDKSDRRHNQTKKAWLDNMDFCCLDIFKNTNHVIEKISKPNTFLFIDNGNKKKEVNLFVRHLGPNSSFVVHDVGREIDVSTKEFNADIKGFVPVFNEYAEMFSSSCRFWKREPIH